MPKALVVVQPFAGHAKGDRITDPDTIAKVLVDHDNRVLKIEIPDAPDAHEAPASKA